jgi:Lrp/AsnC family transcriptional regulator, regulator for asnA, asnC and gidA
MGAEAKNNAVETSTSRLELDDLDKQIVQLLHKDGRMPYTEIAKRLGPAEATIRYRVQRLIETGAITIQAYLNPDKLGYRQMALLNLRCSNLERAEVIAAELSSLDAISYVAFIAGPYDLFIEVTYDDHAGLLEFLSQVRRMRGVVSCETQVVLKLLKSQYSYQIQQ